MTYEQDLIYNNQQDGYVYSGAPTSGEGENNAETWRPVPDKGLYHFKKYNGSWYSRLFTTEVLTQSDEIQEITHEEFIIQSAEGTFIELKVSGTLDLTGCSITQGYSVTGVLTEISNRQFSLTVGDNFTSGGGAIDTIQGIKTTSSPEFTSLTLNTGPLNLSGNITAGSSTITAESMINKVNVLYSTGEFGSPAVDGIGLGNLTESIATQIGNIGIKTIIASQWEYLATSDQDFKSNSSQNSKASVGLILGMSLHITTKPL